MLLSCSALFYYGLEFKRSFLEIFLTTIIVSQFIGYIFSKIMNPKPSDKDE